MHPMLINAVKAARKAGAIINRAAQDVSTIKVMNKTYNDFVSEVDHASEQAIIETLKEAYPNHSFLGEESGQELNSSEYLWIIDPLDGTTNFILTKMDESGAAFSDALKEAQALGFAEADPTADVEGFDAAAKAAILASLAFHSRVTDSDVFREGITKITATDVAVAKSLNLIIKLLAIADLNEKGEISVRVHPTLISRSHPLGLRSRPGRS